MELPPGPLYLLQLFPYFALPSTIVYLFLTSSEKGFGFALPSSLVIAATIIAKPALFILKKYYRKLVDIRAASASDAMLPPYVQESTLTIISDLRESMRDGYPAEVMQRWADEYGSVVRFDLLTFTGVVTAEPEHVKAILATQFDSFEKGPIFHTQMNSLLGTGIFNADGDMWKFHRSITRPFFTRERISDFEIYNRNCDLSLKEAKNRLAEGYSIDFQDLVSRFTLDSATEFLFGTTVGSLSAGIPYPPLSALKNSPSFYNHPSNIFVNAFRVLEGQVLTGLRYSLGTDWPLGPDFWKNKVTPLRKIMDDFTEPLMKEALTKREERIFKKDSKSEDGEPATLLEHLVGQTQDPKILKDELVNLLVAGRDTVRENTRCVSWPSHSTCSPNTLISSIAFGKKSSRKWDQPITRHMINAGNEVCEGFPERPINARTTTKPVVWPNKDPNQKPFYIPANTICYYTVINMHRRTDLWGPDALKFDPDRFLDERLHKYLTPNPTSFAHSTPFAYHEATFYLVRLLQQFTGFTLDKSTNIQPPAEWASCGGLKATEKGGLWVRMKDLNSSEV
ncbi:cytochrome P450 [Flammula alnicola]|nr:cytochrome P450 [Flammula alnicola]